MGHQKVKMIGRGRSEYSEKGVWLDIELPSSLIKKLRREAQVEEITIGEVIARHCGHLPRYK